MAQSELFLEWINCIWNKTDGVKKFSELSNLNFFMFILNTTGYSRQEASGLTLEQKTNIVNNFITRKFRHFDVANLYDEEELLATSFLFLYHIVITSEEFRNLLCTGSSAQSELLIKHFIEHIQNHGDAMLSKQVIKEAMKYALDISLASNTNTNTNTNTMQQITRVMNYAERNLLEYGDTGTPISSKRRSCLLREYLQSPNTMKKLLEEKTKQCKQLNKDLMLEYDEKLLMKNQITKLTAVNESLNEKLKTQTVNANIAKEELMELEQKIRVMCEQKEITENTYKQNEKRLQEEIISLNLEKEKFENIYLEDIVENHNKQVHQLQNNIHELIEDNNRSKEKIRNVQKQLQTAHDKNELLQSEYVQLMQMKQEIEEQLMEERNRSLVLVDNLKTELQYAEIEGFEKLTTKLTKEIIDLKEQAKLLAVEKVQLNNILASVIRKNQMLEKCNEKLEVCNRKHNRIHHHVQQSIPKMEVALKSISHYYESTKEQKKKNMREIQDLHKHNKKVVEEMEKNLILEKEKYSGMLKKNTKLEEILDSTKQTNKKLTERINEFNSKESRNETLLVELHDKNQLLSEENQNIKKEIKDVEGRYEITKASLDKLNIEYKTTINQNMKLNEKIIIADASLEKMNNENQNLTAQIDKLNNKIETANARCETLEESLKKLQLEHESLQEENTLLKNEILAAKVGCETTDESVKKTARGQDIADKLLETSMEHGVIQHFIAEQEEQYEAKLNKMKKVVIEKVHKEYSAKLEKAKGDLKNVYLQQCAEANEKWLQKEEKYKQMLEKEKEHNKELSEQFWHVSDDYLKLKQHQQRQGQREQVGLLDNNINNNTEYEYNLMSPKTFARKCKSTSQLNLLQDSNSQILTSKCDIRRQSSVSQNSLYPINEFNRKKYSSLSSTVGKKFSLSTAKVFPTAEDEEGEIFDNACLSDLKKGICDVSNSNSNSLSNRLSVLQARNSLCPPHLKSSYPAETQFLPLQQFKEDYIKTGQPASSYDHNSDNENLIPLEMVNKQTTTNSQRFVGDGTCFQTVYKKPGPPTPTKSATKQQVNAKPNARISNTHCATPRGVLRESNRIDIAEGPGNNKRKSVTPGRRLFGLFCARGHANFSSAANNNQNVAFKSRIKKPFL